MALIPLKQTVMVTSAMLDANGKTKLDKFGKPLKGEPTAYKCRIQEGAKLVRAQTNTSGNVHGISAQEVVSTAQIYFDKHAAIGLQDEIEYVDESGAKRKYNPITIERKRGLNGKTLLTVVYV